MIETDGKERTGKFTIDTEYFIQLAMRKEIPWNSLAFVLTDLTTNLEISKQVIRILVQELEKLALTGETGTHERNTTKVNIQIEDDERHFGEPENATEYFNLSDLENEPIVSDIEDQSLEAKEEELSKNEIDIQTELTQIGESETVIDFPAEDFYEFIGDNEKTSTVSVDDDKFEHFKEETGLNVINEDIQEKNEEIVKDRKDKKKECTFCSKHFGNKSKRVIHERIHTGERPFECKVCQKTFICKGALNKHEMIHTGEKPYQCQNCKKFFNDSGTLKNHEKIHSGEKPFQCKTCTQCFARAGSLKIHEMIHNGQKPYQCHKCKACFRQSGDLKVHERIHTGEKPYQCKICKASFTQSGILKKT